MITSSGAVCDVCGEYILPLDPEEKVNCFGIEGIEETLHCDNKCKEIIELQYDETEEVYIGFCNTCNREIKTKKVGDEQNIKDRYDE